MVEDAPLARRTVVWLDSGGLDGITAAGLARVGVDEVVVRRGVVDLAGEAPVLRFESKPPLAGGLPVGFLLETEGAHSGLIDGTAGSVWRALMGEEHGVPPVEILLDIPELPDGMATFVRQLAAASGIPVVPVLSISQLKQDEAIRVAQAAGQCLVPAYGTGSPSLRGVHGRGVQPLAKELEPLAGTGVRVRIGIGLEPVVRPELGVWGDDLGPLTESGNADIRTSSELDRTFLVQRPLDWSGRSWEVGDEIAARWWDGARLQASLAEIDRLVLPEVIGWDLVPLPPPGPRLGMGEEALLSYLAGNGPAPTVRVELSRSGGTVRATMTNEGSFVTAVSGAGNWLEVGASQGALVVRDRGSFDAIELGTRRGGGWDTVAGGVADAVRFHDTYLAPGEVLTTGPIRLTVSRSEVKVRWHLLLSSGEEVSGSLVR